MEKREVAIERYERMVKQLRKCEESGKEKYNLAPDALDKEHRNVFVVTRQTNNDEGLNSVQLLLSELEGNLFYLMSGILSLSLSAHILVDVFENRERQFSMVMLTASVHVGSVRLELISNRSWSIRTSLSGKSGKSLPVDF